MRIYRAQKSKLIENFTLFSIPAVEKKKILMEDYHNFFFTQLFHAHAYIYIDA